MEHIKAKSSKKLNFCPFIAQAFKFAKLQLLILVTGFGARHCELLPGTAILPQGRHKHQRR